MKIKTLAVIGLLALAPVQTVEFNAASNTTVKVVRDTSGKVDYKWFYKNGKKVKYEDWNQGKKLQINKYNNGKVDTKTYYNTSGKKVKYEDWGNGHKWQTNRYKNGKVTKKYFYDIGNVLVKTENWNNGTKVSSKWQNGYGPNEGGTSDEFLDHINSL